MNQGKSLQLFFVNGIADGMLTAHISNWTESVLSIPRTQIRDGLERSEASFIGVYILIGEADGKPQNKVYVGEGENVSLRIRTHDAEKDWWTRVVIITTTANSLNKAHIKYLESRLIEEAKNAAILYLDNGNTPLKPRLSESDSADMEQFIEQLRTVLPAIRVDGFVSRTRPMSNDSDRAKRPSENAVSFLLETKSAGVRAIAKLINGEFIVQPESIGRKIWLGGDRGYKGLFDEVVDSKCYVVSGENRVFVKPYAFSSASAAGAVLNGRSTAGPTAWRLESDPSLSYKQWEKDQLSSIAEP